MRTIEFPGVKLEWIVPPASWQRDGRGVTVVAAPRTDIFINPVDGETTVSAARALTSVPDRPWQFGARIGVDFRSAWDAGALLIWADETRWAKLNFERSPTGPPGVYSVVTRGRSDDAVGWTIDAAHMWLRISRIGDAFAFHASDDGRAWQLVRQFVLDERVPVRVGIEVQSPIGDGCTVTFDNLTLSDTHLTNIFDGT